MQTWKAKGKHTELYFKNINLISLFCIESQSFLSSNELEQRPPMFGAPGTNSMEIFLPTGGDVVLHGACIRRMGLCLFPWTDAGPDLGLGTPELEHSNSELPVASPVLDTFKISSSQQSYPYQFNRCRKQCKRQHQYDHFYPRNPHFWSNSSETFHFWWLR